VFINPHIHIQRILSVCLALLWATLADAQSLAVSKERIRTLCSAEFSGRGYLDSGVLKASNYLAGEMASIGLTPMGNSFLQPYHFAVNTHPGPVQCLLDGQALNIGTDFLIDAQSPSVSGRFVLLHYQVNDSQDKILLYKKIRKGFQPHEALVLHQSSKRSFDLSDSFNHYRNYPAVLVYTEEKKMTHTIGRRVDRIPTLVIMDSVIKKKELLEVQWQNQFLAQAESRNVIGMRKVKRSDSFIVFTAHFDHLGRQGEAVFPGASDNASGTSMVLYLADYFKKHKPTENMVFILFSGEEAGLLGSEYFVQHPTFDVKRIKMLINIDIMGSAEKGITVVNGEVFREQFNRLVRCNESKHYLPEVKIRGKAKNSDHYHFSELGIPSFFIYSMGGKGYYHDVFDTADQLDLKNYEQVAQLLIDFVSER